MNDIYNFIVENKTAILVGLLGISELLALMPKVKSNSVFQLIVNTLSKLKNK